MGITTSKDVRIKVESVYTSSKVTIRSIAVDDPTNVEPKDQPDSDDTLIIPKASTTRRSGLINENIKTLRELVALFVPILLTRPDEFKPSTIFMRKICRYELEIKEPDGMEDLLLLVIVGLDQDLYEACKINEPLSQTLRRYPTCKTFYFGHLDTKETIIKVGHEIYVPEDVSTARTFTMFLIKEHMLAKARVSMISTINVLAELPYFETPNKPELEDDTFTRLTTNSILNVFSAESLLRGMSKQSAIIMPPSKYIVGTQNTNLAYRLYQPCNREGVAAIVVAVSAQSFFLDCLAANLATMFPMAVYVCEPRGFGRSAGKRGCSSSKHELLGDIRSFVRLVRNNSHSTTTPVLLMGQLLSSALVINYSNWKDQEKVDGYILISSHLGLSIFPPNKGSKVLRQQFIDQITRHLDISQGSADYTINFGDQGFKIFPGIVSTFSPNTVLAFRVSKPRKVLKKIKAPIVIMIGEDNEIIDAHALVAYLGPRLAHIVKIRPKETHFDTTLSAHVDLGRWIMGLETVQQELARPVPSPLVISCFEKITIPYDQCDKMVDLKNRDWRSVEREELAHLVNRSNELGLLNCHPNWIEMDDASLLEFQVFSPPSHCIPFACLVFVAPTEYSALIAELASQYKIKCFRTCPWGIFRSRKNVWMNVKRLVQHVAANHSSIPVFLGGLGFGASIVLNYAGWEERHQVNGYIVISPIPHPSKSVNRPISRRLLREVVDLPEHLAKLLKSTCQLQQYLPFFHGSCVGNIQFHFSIHKVYEISPRIMEAMLAENLIDQIVGSDAPILVLLGEKDELVQAKELYDRLSQLLKPPFQSVELVPEERNISVVGKVTDRIGRWLEEVSEVSSPGPSIHLKNMALSHFQPLDLIGKGTYGNVWLVRHTPSGRYMAIKIISKLPLVQKHEIRHVIREREILSNLQDSAFIVPYMGAFQDEARLFIVMDFLIGGELLRLIGQRGRLTVDETRFYGAEVLVALEHIHNRGTVYRDLKPENVLLDSLGHVRLIDFGFAKHLGTAGKTSSFCGSPFYIAPEMLRPTFYDYSVDYWTFGVLLYEMATGKPPFLESTANCVYRKILLGRVEFPPAMDPLLRDLIGQLLALRPEDRLGSKGGITAIKAHLFFGPIDWDQLVKRLVVPPYQPKFESRFDTRNFAQYPDKDMDSFSNPQHDPSELALLADVKFTGFDQH